MGCLFLAEPLLQALDKVIEQGQKAIVNDPRCAIDVNVAGRKWPGRFGHTASLVSWQSPPGIVGILHLFVPLAVLPEEFTQVAAPGFQRCQDLAFPGSRK